VKNSGRLAIHRRSEEIEFLQHRLRALDAAYEAAEDQKSNGGQRSEAAQDRDKRFEVLRRERELADELLHTRQIEPLGEALQRRLAMAERICFELSARSQSSGEPDSGSPGAVDQEPVSNVHRIAEVERQALMEMTRHWWAWLRRS
jgi:hypothetical protein